MFGLNWRDFPSNRRLFVFLTFPAQFMTFHEQKKDTRTLQKNWVISIRIDWILLCIVDKLLGISLNSTLVQTRNCYLEETALHKGNRKRLPMILRQTVQRHCTTTNSIWPRRHDGGFFFIDSQCVLQRLFVIVCPFILCNPNICSSCIKSINYCA